MDAHRVVRRSKGFLLAALLLSAIFVFTGTSDALEIVLEPTDRQLK